MSLSKRGAVAMIGVTALLATFGVGQATASAATPPRLTNLAHLDFLLDSVAPAATPGHTTYDLASDPKLTMPWVYANANDDGTFTRVGGGDLDAATGHYGQGAFDTDDIARAAVVYLRDWKQTGSASSRQKAYELLRSTAYFQTTTGKNAGNVVLWMQPDGTLNTSPTPVDTPNPSDSDASYWLARSLWAFGEGYADFKRSDPAFARFLKQRIDLGVKALDREVLSRYGRYKTVDGVRQPAWLIGNGADESAEALLGLTAYTAVAPADRAPRVAASELAKGIARMSAGSPTQWPYGAILPSTASPSQWHAWSSQMPAALANASVVLHNRTLLSPAVTDSVSFTSTLLAADGPDNAWSPTPVDQTQIAYGADSRLQSLLAVARATGRSGIRQLAGIEAAWYFGANRAGKPVYDPATGVTTDGIAADGTVSKNGGAESTIHGLLSMLALDANPDVAQIAQSTAHVSSRNGLTVAEAESAAPTTGTVITPSAPSTPTYQWSGGKYLELKAGQSATIALPSVSVSASGARSVEPVVRGSSRSTWSGLGTLVTSGSTLLPRTLARSTSASSVTVTVTKGTLDLDAVISRPAVERLVLTGSGTTTLLHSTVRVSTLTSVGAAGVRTTVREYDARGRLLSTRTATGVQRTRVAAGGFAVARAVVE